MLKERRYSVLLVSSNEKFNTAVNPLLTQDEFSPVDIATSVAAAKRKVLEKQYDIVLINTPLSDEFGANFAIDIASDSNSGVLLFIKVELYDEITSKTEDYGILTVAKPTNKTIIRQSLKLLCATRDRLYRMEKKAATFEEKMEEIKLVNRAKWILIDNLSMTEELAHKYIEKLAMNSRLPRKRVAENIIAEYSGGEGR